MSASSWKCPECGFEMKDGDVRVCSGCGYINFGRLVLEGNDGARTTVSIDTELGKQNLAKLVGDEAQYAAAPQFLLKRDAGTGRWNVSHASGAKNPTFVNGVQLADVPAVISDGDVISVGPEKAKVHVRIES